jgi:hypothetical protein
MATLNCHLAYTDQSVKFWDWEKFLSECSGGASSNVGVGECCHAIFEGTSKHLIVE